MQNEVWLGIDVGVRNLSYCVLRKCWNEWFIDKWENLDIIKLYTPFKSFRQMKVMDMHVLIDVVAPALFPLQGSPASYNHVVIEQQPFGQQGNSQKLGLFSHLLYRYFEESRRKALFNDCLYSVNIQSAKSKYCSAWLTCYNLSKEKVYAKRKALSIKLCKMLQETNSVKVVCSVSKRTRKLDDLADAFLLAFYAASFNPNVGLQKPLGSLEVSLEPEEEEKRKEEEEERKQEVYEDEHSVED